MAFIKTLMIIKMKWILQIILFITNAMILLIKEVLGIFKDECSSSIITGFVGLRPKCFAFQFYGEEKEYKKCKGAAKHVVRRQLTYKEYDKVLQTNGVIHKSFNGIRSKNHIFFSIRSTKISLNSYENKRYWTNTGGILAYGHWRIKEMMT